MDSIKYWFASRLATANIIHCCYDKHDTPYYYTHCEKCKKCYYNLEEEWVSKEYCIGHIFGFKHCDKCNMCFKNQNHNHNELINIDNDNLKK